MSKKRAPAFLWTKAGRRLAMTSVMVTGSMGLLSTPAANAAEQCVDTDGDGWGWTGDESCRPDDSDQPNDVCTDSDGDGWGWDGGQTCLPAPPTAQAIGETHEQPDGVSNKVVDQDQNQNQNQSAPTPQVSTESDTGWSIGVQGTDSDSDSDGEAENRGGARADHIASAQDLSEIAYEESENGFELSADADRNTDDPVELDFGRDEPMADAAMIEVLPTQATFEGLDSGWVPMEIKADSTGETGEPIKKDVMDAFRIDDPASTPDSETAENDQWFPRTVDPEAEPGGKPIVDALPLEAEPKGSLSFKWNFGRGLEVKAFGRTFGSGADEAAENSPDAMSELRANLKAKQGTTGTEDTPPNTEASDGAAGQPGVPATELKDPSQFSQLSGEPSQQNVEQLSPNGSDGTTSQGEGVEGENSEPNTSQADTTASPEPAVSEQLQDRYDEGFALIDRARELLAQDRFDQARSLLDEAELMRMPIESPTHATLDGRFAAELFSAVALADKAQAMAEAPIVFGTIDQRVSVANRQLDLSRQHFIDGEFEQADAALSQAMAILARIPDEAARFEASERVQDLAYDLSSVGLGPAIEVVAPETSARETFDEAMDTLSVARYMFEEGDTDDAWFFMEEATDLMTGVIDPVDAHLQQAFRDELFALAASIQSELNEPSTYPITILETKQTAGLVAETLSRDADFAGSLVFRKENGREITVEILEGTISAATIAKLPLSAEEIAALQAAFEAKRGIEPISRVLSGTVDNSTPPLTVDELAANALAARESARQPVKIPTRPSYQGDLVGFTDFSPSTQPVDSGSSEFDVSFGDWGSGTELSFGGDGSGFDVREPELEAPKPEEPDVPTESFGDWGSGTELSFSGGGSSDSDWNWSGSTLSGFDDREPELDQAEPEEPEDEEPEPEEPEDEEPEVDDVSFGDWDTGSELSFSDNASSGFDVSEPEVDDVSFGDWGSGTELSF